MKELKDLKLAFVQKGDEEREAAKAKFLRNVRRQRGDPEPAAPKKVEGEEEAEEEKGQETGDIQRAPEDKLRLVEKIIAMKYKQQANAGRGRRTRDEDDVFGEDGLDIDTYESRYADGNAEQDDDEDVPLKGGRPPVEEVRGNDRRGGRGSRGDRRGGDRRGGDRRGGDRREGGGYSRGGFEERERGARSKSRGPPR